MHKQHQHPVQHRVEQYGQIAILHLILLMGLILDSAATMFKKEQAEQN